MLELLELQARARAIRSQLALEPVTKIELHSDDEENDEDASNNVAGPSSKANDKTITKDSIPVKKLEAVATSSAQILQPVVRRVPPPPPAATKPVVTAKPLKLKRNYKSRTSENSNSSTLTCKKEPSPPKAEESQRNGKDDDDRCSSPDVINMDPSPETFFISDSEDDEPPTKKTPEKKEQTPVDEAMPEKVEPTEKQQPEDGEISDASSKEESHEVVETLGEDEIVAVPAPEDANDNAMNDDDVVHLMSDTEIELHHQSDKEDEEPEAVAEVKTQDNTIEPSTAGEVEKIAAKVEQQTNFMSDDDVVEIHNSSDDEMMNESDDKSVGESTKLSQTWEQRWLSSSKTQNILKTTQLASKVRVNMLKTKKTQKATEKKKVENEKSMKEKVLNQEEGSMKQFKTIKESSN